MIKKNMVIALRSLLKSRFYTVINILGLAVGIASCMIIILFLINELSYDRHFCNADRIYRVDSEIKFGSNHFTLASVFAPVADLLQQNYPEIESATRLSSWGPRFVRKENTIERIREEHIIWADSTFFKVFSVNVLEGNAAHALKETNSIAISRTIAAKYFPGGNALGQTLILDDNWNHKVTAVFEDIPSNSHFHFDMLVAMAGLQESKSLSLVGGNDFHTYILLKKGADKKMLEAKFPSMFEKYVAPQLSAAMGGDFTLAKFQAAGNIWAYTLMPLKDIHLHSDLMSEIEPNGSIAYVYLFSVIAFFILVIACINFMNLSTARSVNRMKEVGVKKVMGSISSQLMIQFLEESCLISLFSVVLAVIMAYLLLPVFNELALKNLTLPFKSFMFYVYLLAISMVVGILAGLYPSFYLSSFKPISLLKDRVTHDNKVINWRSALVVFQFIISIFLIICTITINRQLNYIQHKKLGFEKDQVIIVSEAQALGNKIRVFKEEVLKNSLMNSGTISGYLPVSGTWRNNNTFWKEGMQPSQENMQDMVSIQTWGIDLDYMKTLGMHIKQGREFSAEYPSDSSGIILNETAVKRFDFGEDVVGKKINCYYGSNEDGTPSSDKIKSWTIIGVVEDFHFESFKQSITPLSFYLGQSTGNVSFRFKGKNAGEVVQLLEKKWKNLVPGQPFQYSFLDEQFDRMYASEHRLGKIFLGFAALAIFIACLGLFALTSFTAEQRTKEIGIRKALGASVSKIILMLSWDFGKLLVISFITASVGAYYAISWWLKNYSYKIEVGWMVYLLSGILALFIAWITVSYQSIRAATANPANSLKTE
jgi:putative ABC transport system permease protein